MAQLPYRPPTAQNLESSKSGSWAPPNFPSLDRNVLVMDEGFIVERWPTDRV